MKTIHTNILHKSTSEYYEDEASQGQPESNNYYENHNDVQIKGLNADGKVEYKLIDQPDINTPLPESKTAEEYYKSEMWRFDFGKKDKAGFIEARELDIIRFAEEYASQFGQFDRKEEKKPSDEDIKTAATEYAGCHLEYTYHAIRKAYEDGAIEYRDNKIYVLPKTE